MKVARDKLDVRIVMTAVVAVLVPLAIAGALGLRTLVVYLTESPLRRALPHGATGIEGWSWTEPGPLGQDGSAMLRARIPEDAFEKYAKDLGMTPHTANRAYGNGFSPSYVSLADEPLDWWDPTDEVEGTWVLDQGSSWTWAKWENGFVYVLSWSI